MSDVELNKTIGDWQRELTQMRNDLEEAYSVRAAFQTYYAEATIQIRDLTVKLAVKDSELAVARFNANHDFLTKALNRRGLFEAAASNEYRYCVVIDVDGLKAINDTHGHAAGDEYMLGIVRDLDIMALSGDGVLARVGGDEYIMLTKTFVQMISDERYSKGWVDIQRYADLDQAINAADAQMNTRKRSRKSQKKG